MIQMPLPPLPLFAAIVGLVLLSTFAAGDGICPLRQHLVCNADYPTRACLCAMSMHEDPPPYPSCAAHDTEKPEATSLKLRVEGTLARGNSSIFPERQMRRQLASALKVDERSIIFLRFRCAPEADNVIIAQFIVVKRGRAVGKLPIPTYDLMNPDTVVSRINALQPIRLSGLVMLDAEPVTELHLVESFTDNTRLAIEAAIAGLFVLATCLCGCLIACRRGRPTDDYDDRLQEKA